MFAEFLCAHKIFCSVVATMLTIVLVGILAAIYFYSGSKLINYFTNQKHKVPKKLTKEQAEFKHKLDKIFNFMFNALLITMGISFAILLIYSIISLISTLYGWWVLHICNF